MHIGIGVYVENSVQAVKLYQSAFGLELGYHVLNEDGSFFHSELCKDDVPYLAVVEGKTNVKENPVQLGFGFETREEVDNAFRILKENGTVLMDLCELPWCPYAAEVVDQFGIRWYLSLPNHRPDDDFTPADCK